ncbi:MAG: translation initiation factor [Cyanothece sp. SIO1E1]|nr:translation initiation factor [Cyanothece sp. SIO1E1]
MAAAKRKGSKGNEHPSSQQGLGALERLRQGDRVVYSEFGHTNNSAATERAVPELPPNQQNLKVQASRKGRKGKTVTVISGFQLQPESLASLAKQLKAQCGTGGTVKDNTIEIQGDHAQKLVQLLIKLGYKAKISGG